MSESKFKSIKISPIKKEFSDKLKTQESSLATYGYVRMPGTKMIITPKREADGRYRTGVDPEAPYVKNIRDEGEKAAELSTIKEILTQLKEVYGTDTDFGPRSKVWQAFSDAPIKVTPIVLSNNDIILHTNSPEDLLTYAWIRKHPAIAKSLESFKRGDCPDCQYYLADDAAENKMLYAKKKKINKAIVEFEALSPTKALQVARLMGLPVTESSTAEYIYNQMDNMLKKPEFEKGDYEGLSTISVFNDIIALTDDKMYTKDLVKQAIRHNIYRVAEGGKMYEGTETVAASEAELVKWLMEPANQKDLIALETRVKNKRIIAE